MYDLIIAATALFTLGYGCPLQAQAEVELDAQHVFGAKGEVNYAILQIAREAHRPVGIVGNTWGEHCNAPVSIEAGTLRSALDMIAAQCPVWSWHRVGRSIVFHLSRTVDSPLEVVVGFYSATRMDWAGALIAAMDAPEIKAWLKENDETANQEWVISGVYQSGKHVEPKKEPLVSIRLNHVKLAGLFDEIASAAGYSVWYMRVEGRGRQVIVSLR